MAEVESYDEKESWVNQFMSLRPDLFFPVSWDDDRRKKVLEEVRPSKTRTMMFASIPLICKGPNCHPVGTMISTNMGEVPIEELTSEHKVLAWDINNDTIRGRSRNSQILGFQFTRQDHLYSGWMVNIETENGYGHWVTHDHISIVKWTEKSTQRFAVYLMRKGDSWRVGKCKLFSGINKPTFGPKARACSEQAEAFWILGIYETNTEALLAEEFYSLKFVASRACFIATDRQCKWDGLYRWVTQEQLDDHHKMVAPSFESVRMNLLELGLCVDHPFWSKEEEAVLLERYNEMLPYRSRSAHGRKFLLVRACNILTDYMSVPTEKYDTVMQTNGKNRYKPIWNTVYITKKFVEAEKVYSLDVEKYHCYIANGIITHNCPYAETCPLQQQDIAPVTFPCPLELAMVGQFMQEYIEELNVNPNNLVEVSMIRDLVDQEIQYLRKTKILAKDHFIQENVIGYDPKGNPLWRKELHQAVELEDRLHRRKKDLRNQLLATRESRAKVGQVQMDPAQALANLVQQHARLQQDKEVAMRRELGLESVDSYIDVDPVDED